MSKKYLVPIVYVEGGVVQGSDGEIILVDRDSLESGVCPLCACDIDESGICPDCKIDWDNDDDGIITDKIRGMDTIKYDRFFDATEYWLPEEE